MSLVVSCSLHWFVILYGRSKKEERDLMLTWMDGAKQAEKADGAPARDEVQTADQKPRYLCDMRPDGIRSRSFNVGRFGEAIKQM